MLPELWSRSYRSALAGMVLVFCVVLAVQAVRHRQYISDPPPPTRLNALADRLDPNIASWQELNVLPQLGQKRAKAIIAYREQFRANGRGQIAFHKAEDLLRIKGIGVAMMETLRPYLMFPASLPATRRL